MRLYLIILLASAIIISACSKSKRTTQESLLKITSSGSNAAGRGAVEKLLRFVGGSARVRSIKTLRLTYGDSESTKAIFSIVYPDRVVAQISTPHGIDLAVQNPECYWVRDNRLLGVSPNKCVIDNQNLAHNFVNVLQHIDSPHYSFFSEGIRKVGDNPATVVDVNANGAVTRWWIGEDGRLLQELYFSNETIGLGTLIYRYTEWKEVDQLNYPVTYESRDEIREGAPIVSRISKVELNPTVDPTLFIKPDSKRN